MADVADVCGPVLVVDDDASARALITELFAGVKLETVEAGDAESAIDAARERRPGLVILEVNLPGISGYELCRTLRESYGDGMPILFVSGDRVESYDRVAGLLLGADDYVVKPFAPDELLVRARGLLRRAGERKVAANGYELTRRELEVLGLLADGLGQREIAHRLVISPKTVGTHVERILSKLGVHTRAHAVAMAFRHGLLSDVVTAAE
jgi:two-component system nitrate/nitrite response regulator NarL